MSDELYNQDMLALAADVAQPSHLENPDIVETAHSAVCGSQVTVELQIDKNNQTVSDFGYEVEACALTKTVLAIMKTTIIGQNFQQIMVAGERLQRLLDEDETVLAENWGVWEPLKIMETAQDYTMRHHSITLPFAAMQNISN